MDKNSSTIGLYLRELRQRNRLTQTQLGEILNTDKFNISKYENGRRTPSKQTLIKLYEYGLIGNHEWHIVLKMLNEIARTSSKRKADRILHNPDKK